MGWDFSCDLDVSSPASCLSLGPFAFDPFHACGYCVVLHCVALCCVVLCCVVLCYIVLCCVVLCCVVLHCVVLCCVVLCCVVLCCIVLCCVVLCCVALCCVCPWCQLGVIRCHLCGYKCPTNSCPFSGYFVNISLHHAQYIIAISATEGMLEVMTTMFFIDLVVFHSS